MKILYITPRISGEGGVARVLSTKANYLVENFGYKVHILTQNEGNKPLFYVFNNTIPLHDMVLRGNKIFFFWHYYKALKNKIQTIKPDLIIVCDNGLKAYSIPFILKTKIPIIFECHGSKYAEENPQTNHYLTKIKLKFKEFSANKFTKLIALSPENLKEWDVKNGLVIPNPLWLQTEVKAILESKKIIVVARHSYEKGLDRVLIIWQKVTKKHPDWVLEIYGTKSKNDSLERLASSLKIKDSVRFCNPVKNIEEKYLDASILVMTSRTEGFGMVLIEAMACGLPCIAYDCPCGPRSIITDKETGFLIEDGNVDLFVEKLNLLIEDEALRIKFGLNAQESIKKYDLNRIMKQWKTLFESL